MTIVSSWPDRGSDPNQASVSRRSFWLWRRKHILPGFHLTLGFTWVYLISLVLIPLAALFFRVLTPTEDFPTIPSTLSHVYRVATDERAIHSYKLSFGLAFAAALLNGVFGLLVAWTLTRYRFFGRRIADALVDLPFAMPTSVAGLTLTQMFSPHVGYLGDYLHRWLGWNIDYTPWGILIALTFVGFPFVVRTLQPVVAGLVIEAEEAAACLGANRLQTFARVILPALRPALITGIMLAFGRGVGEYGSIVFISGGIANYTEITPQLIIMKLEEYDYTGAAGLGIVMLLMSFLIVITVNVAQHFFRRHERIA